MKKFCLPLALSVAVSMMSTSCGKVIASAKLKTDMDSASYAIGVLNGEGFARSLKGVPGDTLNVNDLIDGFVTALKGKETKISAEDAQGIIQSYFERVQKKIADDNKEAGEKFLEENKSKEGVKVTESGLQYKVIKEGEGEQPTDEDKVKVNYRGTLVNGEEFDKGDSTTFGVNRVIKGWTEGIKLMKVGSKYEFYIPSELAYGERGAGRNIKANAALIFEVELLEIIKPEAKK